MQFRENIFNRFEVDSPTILSQNNSITSILFKFLNTSKIIYFFVAFLFVSCTKKEIFKTASTSTLLDTTEFILSYDYTKFTTRNNHISPMFIDDSIENKNNEDNVIYKPKRQFIYKYKYINHKGEFFLTQYYIKSDAQFLMGRLVPYQENHQDSTIVDRIGMYVYSGKGNTKIGKKRTVIRYDFYNFYKKQTFAIENMSVSENLNEGISIPTFTSLTFITNFLYSFPRLDYPIRIDEEKERIIEHDPLVKSWLALYLNESEIPTQITRQSKVTGFENITSPFKTLNCYKVETIASSYWQDRRMDYYFNEEYGVVKYIFYDAFEGCDLIVELESVTDNI